MKQTREKKIHKEEKTHFQYLLKNNNNPCINGTMQLKPMLFQGQLCYFPPKAVILKGK